MGHSVSTELTKLSSRPAVWVLGLVLFVLVLVLSYFLPYLFFSNAPGPLPPGLIATLLPEQFLSSGISGITTWGSAIALILGAMSVGGEYNWGTFKAALTQGSGKLELFGGKLLALAVILLVFSVVVLGLGALSSYIIARLLEEAVSWPALFEIVKAVLAGWLILAVFCGMGVALATLFRGTALAIGLGLVYLLLITSILSGLAIRSEAAANVSKALPGRNAFELGRAFGDLSGQAQAAAAGTQPVGATQATLVLLGYLVGFIAIALLLFKARDVA